MDEGRAARVTRASPVEIAAGLLTAAAGLSGATVTRDVPYGPGERQNLDIYGERGHRPALVFFYGGGWVKGSREMYGFVGHALAARGITTIIPDYRLRQGDGTSDGAAAVSYCATQTGGPLAIGGHSAGAYIAASLALSADWADWATQVPLSALVGLAGPYRYLGKIRDGRKPPALLMTAGRDTVIDPDDAARLAQRLTDAGGEATVRTYANATHASLVGALSPLLSPLGSVRRDLAAFVRAQHRHA